MITILLSTKMRARYRGTSGKGNKKGKNGIGFDNPMKKIYQREKEKKEEE